MCFKRTFTLLLHSKKAVGTRPSDFLVSAFFQIVSQIDPLCSLGLVNKLWYEEGWQNITHIDLSDGFRNLSANAVRFLSVRLKLLHVASICVEEIAWRDEHNVEISRCVGNLILNCGATLRSIDLCVKLENPCSFEFQVLLERCPVPESRSVQAFDKVLTQKYLTKYGSRLLHLSLECYDVPLKLIKSVVNHCSNLQSFHVACGNQKEIVPLLVENLTNLKQLVLTDVNPSELHPQLASLTSLAKIHLSELPQCVNKWKEMFQPDPATVDADIEALRSRLPSHFDINNLHFGSKCIFWQADRPQIWRRASCPTSLPRSHVSHSPLSERLH